MDPYDLVEATEVASKIPANFYAQLESKKWSERKEVLEALEKATSVPRIQNADFGELVRSLKKTISKDSNIVVVTSAAKCLCQLAQGLRTDFAPHANSSLVVLLEKFKEKKPNVIAVIREAADAVFVGTSLEDTYEDIIKFLDNKNPQIKSETALFLCRTFSNFSSQVPNKKLLRPLINALIKTLSDMDSTVRDNSAMAIGTAMKVIGENPMMPLIADVEPLKITKIKEFCEKAQVNVAPRALANGVAQSQAPAQVTETNGNGDDAAGGDDEDSLYDMLEAVDISNQIPASFYTQIESKKWSERKEALDIVEKVTGVPKIQNADFSELVRTLKKTISKDSNIVVVTSAAKCLCQLAQGLRADFGPHASSSLAILFEKFKEKKPTVISVIRDAADAVFVGTSLEEMFEDIIKFLDNKNPQIKTEMALFLCRTFSNHSAQVPNKKLLRPLINALIKTLSDMDSTVRDNSAMAIGTAMKVIGENSMMPLIADVEPLKITKIKEFCEKAQVKKIPKSVANAMMQPPAPVIPPAAPALIKPTSSATMVRSSSNKKIPPKVTSKPPPTANSASIATNGATVKRTATIIKRSTVNKRASGVPHPPLGTHAPPPAAAAVAAAPTPVATIQPPASIPTPVMQPPPPPPPTQPVIQQLIAQHQPATPVMPTYSTPRLSKQDNLDLLLFRLISDNDEEVLESFNKLEETLSDDCEILLKNRINQILDLNCLQLIKCTSSTITNTKSLKIDKVIGCLMKIFAHRKVVSVANQESVRFLLARIFVLVQSVYLGELTLEKLNKLSTVILDSYEPTVVMCILTDLLNEPTQDSIVEPTKKAIIRSMRLFK